MSYEDLCILRECDYDLQKINFIDEKINECDDNFFLLALEKNGENLQFIPEYYISAEMCITAIKDAPHVIESVPEKFITQELCNLAFKYYPNSLKYIPEKFITKEMLQVVEEIENNMVYSLPVHLHTLSMYKNINKNVNLLRLNSDLIKTLESDKKFVYLLTSYRIEECPELVGLYTSHELAKKKIDDMFITDEYQYYPTLEDYIKVNDFYINRRELDN